MVQARLLDLTRTLRRAGRTVTGVDRVERAYLHHFLTRPEPFFGLVRSAYGYLLLDAAGLAAFEARLEGRHPWGRAGLLARLPRGRDAALAAAESDLRRLAIGRCAAPGLERLLARHLGDAWTYYNVGHSNLTARVLSAVAARGGRVRVMVHDVIPLEHPDFQRPGTVEPFRDKLRRVGVSADIVIYNSADTQFRAEAQFSALGRVPPGLVVHLGSPRPAADPAALPAGLPPQAPYFVTVGTIEPRKNHIFLLDLWEETGQSAPPLLICGARGWRNEETFARLDQLPSNGPIRELAGLSDGAIGALVQGAAGALYPTLAEGYGLPPVEARLLGARVLCNDLGVLREVLGEEATYIPVNRPADWLEKIRAWEGTNPGPADRNTAAGQSWSDHFKALLSSE